METFFADTMHRLEELHRDFKQAIAGLSTTALDWVPGADMNSLCVLVVHVCGAARYWVGDVAMGDLSDRDRDAEFRARGKSEVELVALLDATEDHIRAALEQLTLDDLHKVCPAPGRRVHRDSDEPKTFTLGWSLLHTLEHTSLHLGHAQITRQLWDQQN